MIFHEQPTDPWTDYDFALIEAYQTIQDEICSQCGNPIWLCRSTNNALHFKVKTGECRGALALERHKDAKKPAKDRAKKDEKAEWGKFYFTEVDLLPVEKDAGTPMPTRKDFYEELREKTEALKKGV